MQVIFWDLKHFRYFYVINAMQLLEDFMGTQIIQYAELLFE